MRKSHHCSTTRLSVLQELHDTHPGIAKMKSLAHRYMWWPKMNVDIENIVKTTKQTSYSKGSISPMGMARSTMVKVTLGLCWFIHGTHVPHCH